MNGQAPAVLRGPLVAESFARALLASRRHSLPRHEAEAQARAFAAFQRWWRRQADRHGATSGSRFLHETSAVALLDLLGYRRLAHTEVTRATHLSGVVLAGTRSRVAVLTAPWRGAVPQGHRGGPEVNLSALNNLGVICMSQKRDREAIDIFTQLIDVKGDWADPYYNLACLYSRQGDVPKSLWNLKVALWMNRELKGWAQNDPDLEPLRSRPEYQKIVN